VRDVEYVAELQSSRRASSCGNYRGQKTGRVVEVTLGYEDATVFLYERRTGRLRAKQTFMAPPASCDAIMHSAGKGSTYDSAKVDAWLEAQAR
jgi:hypothetical protein